MAPANRQARENYVAFGLWLLEQQPACPHIATSDEGTSYCRLAEQIAAELEGAGG